MCVFDSCHSGTIADLEVSRALSLVPSAPEHYSAVRYMAPPAAVAKPAEAASSEGKALAPAKGVGRALEDGGVGSGKLRRPLLFRCIRSLFGPSPGR